MQYYDGLDSSHYNFKFPTKPKKFSGIVNSTFTISQNIATLLMQIYLQKETRNSVSQFKF